MPDPIDPNRIPLGPSAANVLVSAYGDLNSAREAANAAMQRCNELIVVTVETAGREVGTAPWKLEQGPDGCSLVRMPVPAPRLAVLPHDTEPAPVNPDPEPAAPAAGD